MTATHTLVKIPPERCTGKFFDDIWIDPNWVAEEKLDGARYMLYLEPNKEMHFYSRRDFPRIDKIGNVPHIAHPSRPYPHLMGTVLDGEIKLPGTKHLSDTTGIMNMGPERAIQAQVNGGWLRYSVFDIVYFKGIDMRPYTYKSRRQQLRDVVASMKNPYIHVVEARQHQKREFYDEIVERGGEGVVFKHLQSRYGQGWVKKKKITDVSVFVIDFQRGKPGKYVNTLGALIVGVYHNNELYEIGKCSGMDDETRHIIWANKESYMFRVCDVRTQELSSHGRLREPRFIRWRDDVTLRDCTLEHVVQAINLGTADKEDMVNV